MSNQGRYAAGFVTGGTWCVDYNMTIPSWPRAESATRILSTDRQGGGSSCNFAVDLRRLDNDIPVATIGVRGQDDDGDFLHDVAVSHSIDASRFHVLQDRPTHKTMAFTARDTGQRTHIFDASCADLMTPDHFQFDGLAGRMLHLGLPGTHAKLDAPLGDDPSGWLTILRKARANGLTTNMELMTIPKDELRRIVLPCLPHLDHLVVNDYEIGALSGRETLDGAGLTRAAEVELAACEMVKRGAMEIVVVHFPRGAIAVAKDGTVARQSSVAFPPDRIVGANGAGDAFAAGFFCARAHELPLQNALALGHTAAAASLGALGTTEGVKSASECMSIADQFGWREA